MLYFLDEPVVGFPKTVNGGLSNSAIASIVISIFIVIAVAVLIISILKTNKNK